MTTKEPWSYNIIKVNTDDPTDFECIKSIENPKEAFEYALRLQKELDEYAEKHETPYFVVDIRDPLNRNCWNFCSEFFEKSEGEQNPCPNCEGKGLTSNGMDCPMCHSLQKD